jgi:hypothetical protein
MTTATAAIANHLNIAESIISSVEEWAHVLFVRFVGRRPRFVSKKVVKPMTLEEVFVDVATQATKKLGRGVVESGKTPSISFYPMGSVTLVKGNLSIGDCWDDEARFMVRDMWASAEKPEQVTVQTTQSQSQEWYFGAADEESF